MRELPVNFVHQIIVYHSDKNIFIIKRNKSHIFTYKGFFNSIYKVF